MEKFQGKYRIPTTRLASYDYGAHGFYFVTICTKNKTCYFGDIHVETDKNPSENSDEIVEPDNYLALPKTQTDNYLALPKTQTDFHPSLQPTEIGKIAIENWTQIPLHFPFVILDEFVLMPNHFHGILFFNKPDKVDWLPNSFGKQSQNLASVIRGFKASVKRYANIREIQFDWQTRYHDRIIRNEEELNRIREYIIYNPRNWVNDELFQP